MRRDVSLALFTRIAERRFSLHAQRCFRTLVENGKLGLVFSACAEMFLSLSVNPSDRQGFLCMRRDVSLGLVVKKPALRFSLHAQRCFYMGQGNQEMGKVFSACAEMFLSASV